MTRDSVELRVLHTTVVGWKRSSVLMGASAKSDGGYPCPPTAGRAEESVVRDVGDVFIEMRSS